MRTDTWLWVKSSICTFILSGKVRLTHPLWLMLDPSTKKTCFFARIMSGLNWALQMSPGTISSSLTWLESNSCTCENEIACLQEPHHFEPSHLPSLIDLYIDPIHAHLYYILSTILSIRPSYRPPAMTTPAGLSVRPFLGPPHLAQGLCCVARHKTLRPTTLVTWIERGITQGISLKPLHVDENIQTNLYWIMLILFGHTEYWCFFLVNRQGHFGARFPKREPTSEGRDRLQVLIIHTNIHP